MDRRGAELDYLKYNGREYLTALSQLRSSTEQQSRGDFYSIHPRYKFLVQSKFRAFFSIFIGEERIYKLQTQVMYRYYSPIVYVVKNIPRLTDLCLWATLARTIVSI